VLRTRLVAVDGVARQIVDPPTGLALSRVDLTGRLDGFAEAARLVTTEALTPFDLAGGPPVRGTLIVLAPDDHVLSLCLHHVACDEWSIGILYRELAALYEAHRRGTPPA